MLLLTSLLKVVDTSLLKVLNSRRKKRKVDGGME
jgi:hypothetical protein